MRIKSIIIVGILLIVSISNGFAQNQEEKSPEEMAHKESEKLTKLLQLTETQEFYIDSILVSNMTGYKEVVEDLKKSGRNEFEIYKQAAEMWQQKRLDAFKKVLDDQQYIKYLRHIGLGKEYKKGKDGKWYLKSELKKK